jgi:hypothetical protein
MSVVSVARSYKPAAIQNPNSAGSRELGCGPRKDEDPAANAPGVAAPRIKISIINSNKNNYHRDSEHI